MVAILARYGCVMKSLPARHSPIVVRARRADPRVSLRPPSASFSLWLARTAESGSSRARLHAEAYRATAACRAECLNFRCLTPPGLPSADSTFALAYTTSSPNAAGKEGLREPTTARAALAARTAPLPSAVARSRLSTSRCPGSERTQLRHRWPPPTTRGPIALFASVPYPQCRIWYGLATRTSQPLWQGSFGLK